MFELDGDLNRCSGRRHGDVWSVVKGDLFFACDGKSACRPQLKLLRQPMLHGVFVRLDALNRLLAAQTADVIKGRAEAAFSALFGMSRGMVRGLSGAEPNVLAELLRLAYRHIRPEHDARREGGFTPDGRDDAETARNQVLSALMRRGGECAYILMMGLINDGAFGPRAHRLRQITHEMAEADAERPRWQESEVVEFERRCVGPIGTGGDLLALVGELLDEIAVGFVAEDFSSRRSARTGNERAAGSPNAIKLSGSCCFMYASSGAQRRASHAAAGRSDGGTDSTP